MMSDKIAALVAAVVCICANAHATPTTDRLGYAASDKILVIHADDVGMSHGENLASFDVLAGGLVRSGSVMVPCPWVPEAIAWAKAHPDVDLGVHVTLTSEWHGYRWAPVAGRERVPSLVDADGYLWPDVSDVIAHASPADVETEIRAQVDRALALGLKPTHLDAHMGAVFGRPDFIKAYLKIAGEKRLMPLLTAPSEEAIATARARGLPVEEIAKMFEAAAKAGFVPVDVLVDSVAGRTAPERRASFRAALESMRPGLTELIVHVARDDEELKGIVAGHKKEAPLRRPSDYAVMSDPETKKLVEKLGLKVVTWGEIAKRAHAGTAPPR